jgi:hypothetical protein
MTEIKASDIVEGDELKWKNDFWIITNKWNSLLWFLNPPRKVVILNGISESTGSRELIFFRENDEVTVLRD